MSVLAIPTALDLLTTQILSATDPENIALPLRALQLRGLSKLELVVHIERLRAANDASANEEPVEENCLIALDIVNGVLPGMGLRWDAAEAAVSLYPRCLSGSDLAEAVDFALQPSDLLPPRSASSEPLASTGALIAQATGAAIGAFSHSPTRCDFVRVPKGAFTSRPAALLAIPDRLLLEALTSAVESRLVEVLPDAVVWPRTRAQAPSHRVATDRVLDWQSHYVVKADVSAFYENVEHALLAVLVASNLEIAVPRARAIESTLTAVMGISRGLPQGPAASDVLASSYLLPIDLLLAETGHPFVRYADDYFFPAASMGEGRQLLQSLEGLLRDLGLSLNDRKTQIMRRSTYERGLKRPSPAVSELKEQLTERQVEQVQEIEDADELEHALTAAGVEEEMLWDLLYHGTASLEDLLPDIRDALGPSLANTYLIYVRQIAVALASENRIEELGSLERLARECLVFLAATDSEIDPRSLEEIQKWFPSLTPLVVNYLATRHEDNDWVGEYVKRSLSKPSRIDWVDAWMCAAAGAAPPDMLAELTEELQRLATDRGVAPLTRAEALRGLALLGSLSERVWRSVFDDASKAVRSEMLFAALGELEQYPWLRAHIEEASDPTLTTVAGALQSGDRIQ